MKILKLLGRAFNLLLILIVVLVATSVVFSNVNAPGGYRLFIIQSGSMEPAIKTGSVVMVAAMPEYKEGDIITFWENPNARKITDSITHRIVAVEKQEDKTILTTKGDANQAPDREKIDSEEVLGKVIFSLPVAGRIVAFAKTQTGFFTLVAIPAVLIVYSELLTVRDEIKKLVAERKKRKLFAAESIKVLAAKEASESNEKKKKKPKQ